MKNLQLKTIQSLSLILLFGLFMTTSNKVVAQDIEDLVFYNSENGFVDDMVTALQYDNNGNLWIGTYNNGAFMYDGSSFAAIPDTYSSDNLYVTDFALDPEGNIWMSTKFNDLGCVYKLVDDQFEIQFDGDSGFGSNDVSDIHFEQDGTFWVATYLDGIFKTENLIDVNFEDPFSDVSSLVVIHAVDRITQIGDDLFFPSGGTNERLLQYNTISEEKIIWGSIQPASGEDYEYVTLLPAGAVTNIVKEGAYYWLSFKYSSESNVIARKNSFVTGIFGWDNYEFSEDIQIEDAQNIFIDKNHRIWTIGYTDNVGDDYLKLSSFAFGNWINYDLLIGGPFNPFDYRGNMVEDQNSEGLWIAGPTGLYLFQNTVLTTDNLTQQRETNNGLKVYPNPAPINSDIKISSNKWDGFSLPQVTITNQMGQIVKGNFSMGSKNELYLSIDKPGIYFARIQFEDQIKTTKLFIF